MPRISLDAAHGLEDQHRHFRLGLIPGQRNPRHRGANAVPGDVPWPSMVQGVGNHIILAFRAVAISRLQFAEAEEDFVNGFFEDVLHWVPTAGAGGVCAGLTLKTPSEAGGKTPSGRVDRDRDLPHNCAARRVSYLATGNGRRSRTGDPVKVDPVVPVSSTVKYRPIIDSSPGMRTVLKSRVRA